MSNISHQNTRPELYIKIISTDQYVSDYYIEAARKTHSDEYKDSGFDLITTENVEYNDDFNNLSDAKLLGMGIQCAPNFSSGYYLCARSSIVKTPLIMANCIGIIDQTYRGEIKGAVKFAKSHTINKCTRLFQLCHPSLVPMKVIVVDELDETTRGSGGFGSTD
jgi:dUTP pyrophosphatase